MRKKIYNVLFIIVIAVVIVCLLIFASKVERNKIHFNTERSLVKCDLTSTYPLTNKYDLMKVGSDGVLFASWEEDKQGKIFQYDLNQKKIAAKLDFNSNNDKDVIVGDYFMSKDSSILVNNLDNSIIIQYEGREIFKKKYQYPITRSIFFKNKFLISTWDNNYSLQFFKYDLTSGKSEEILWTDGFKEKDVQNSGITLDGNFSMNENIIAFTSYAQNYVFIFDLSMNLLKHFTLNFVNPEFKYKRTNTNQLVMDPFNIYPNISSALDEDADILYVLTNNSGEWKTNGTFYIDKYDVNSGKYINSMSLEVDKDISAPKEIKIYDNKIYLLCNDKVLVYEKEKF